MHGQQTMKFLNDKAVADAIMAKADIDGEAKKTQAALEAYLVEKAKSVAK